MCVCVVSVIVKRPVLPLCVVDGRSRNTLYYYYYPLQGQTGSLGINQLCECLLYTLHCETFWSSVSERFNITESCKINCGLNTDLSTNCHCEGF